MKEDNNNHLDSEIFSHYAKIAASYDQYSQNGVDSDYQNWILDHVLHDLQLKPTDQLVDLGCGTGGFSSLLYSKAALTQNVLAVEPNQLMLNHAQAWPGLTTHCTDAFSFVQDHAIRYDKILMNKMIHHLRSADLPQLYRGIYQQLRQGGILVTVTRPTIIDIPFFQAALEEWQKQAHPTDTLVKDMSAAGFEVSYQACYYPVQIAKTQWFKMIKRRFWSTFSYFNDQELEAGLAELESKYAQTEILKYQDPVTFIQAVKR